MGDLQNNAKKKNADFKKMKVQCYAIIVLKGLEVPLPTKSF